MVMPTGITWGWMYYSIYLYILVIPIGQLLYTDVGWQLPIAASNIPNIQNLPNSVSINVPAINVSPDNISLAKDRLQYRPIGNSTPKTTQVC